MIRRLVESDHDLCMTLLQTKSAENLFIIGDIENYGYDQPFQQLWGDFDASGKLVAVLLRYQENYIPFALSTFDAKGFAEIMIHDSSFSMLSGLKAVTAQIAAHLPNQPKRLKETYYAKCTRIDE